MQIGDKHTWERTFTNDDVRLFEQVSRDHSIQHILPDEKGRIMVQALLTATLPAKIAGNMNYIVQEMMFEFILPVYVGDTIYCEVTITQLVREQKNTQVSAVLFCRNQDGKTVLTGRTSGIIRAPKPMTVGLN
jgi:acyl dehydratase